ncbi:phage tail tape measure protein [Acinetobacter nosocomialis]|uniref:phage tail tape measure protein n=1 Tax=Acinetobacter nosocomialis TaxID=106654 RepID=UPI001AE4DB69|nr:phage tail tape measure protein [Acinetobacter nosocomialis]MBP1470622.1 phage tail tape measure protein [Acinetobacter nosocomialis]
MAKNGVIRDFLVSLGFDTDNSGLANMKSAMDGIEWKAKALNGVLMALATGAVVAVRQTASELDKLYFSSQRIGASVTNINAYGNAIAQLGGSADGAIGSLESLAEKIRNSPGYEGQLKSLGVTTRDANGAMRDRVEVMKDLSGVLAKMPAYQANAYANSLGIDQKTMLAMRDGKFIANMEKYQKIQKELGMNDDLAKSGNEFMTEYRDLTMMTKTGFQVIVMQAGKALIPILRLLNQLIQAGIHAFSQLNPQIKEGLAIGLRFAMLALMFGAMAKSLGLVLKFIPALKTFIGLLKLFRLAFLASPIGIILALGAALTLLYDDYKTWREGGKSLFDWSKWTNGIDTIINKIKDFLDILNKVKDKTVEFVQKIIKDPAGALKEVATEVQQGVQNAKQAVQNYVNPTDPTKVTPTQEKVASATQAVKSAIEQGVSAATGVAKATVKAVKGAVLPSDNNRILSLVGVEGKRRIYKMADGSVETRDNGTVAWRNNNPGNLKFEFKGSADKTVKSKRTKEKALADARRRYEGIVALDQWGNAIFETYEAGAVAKAKLLKSNHADKTVAKMLRSYAKSDYSGKTNYASYEKTIYKQGDSLGVDLRSKKIGEMSQKEFEALAVGMVKAEGVKAGTVSRTTPNTNLLSNSFNLPNSGVNSNSPPSGNPYKSLVNNSNAMSASNVVVHQSYQMETTIHGASNPIDSANAVKRQQENSLVFMARGARGIFAG